MMKRYDKLVRDKIPEILRLKGKQITVHRASESEYALKLQEKLVEEAREFLESPSLEEFCDVLEVVDAILETQFEAGELARVKEKKKQARGGFSERWVLESVDE